MRFALRLFNPDGSEFEKSGNGLRIFARYLWDRGLPAGPDFDILTPGGPVTAHVLDAAGARIAMDMGRLSFRSTDLGIAGPAREVVNEEVTVGGHTLRIVAATIGNPHCVLFLEAQTPEVQADLGALTAELAHRLGPGLERLALYPNRTNVQFAQAIDRHTLRIEIWERGAAYTLASGTSSCRGRGRGHPHRPLRKPRHRADARRRDACRGRGGWVGTTHGDGGVCLPGRVGRGRNE